MRILIAEDDFTSRRILVTTLRKGGYEVVETKNGLEAWNELKKPDAPKLVILNWMMPGINGVEVCRRIRKVETSISTYIILLTALDSKKDIIRGFEAGVDDYITKPFDSDELHARINAGRRIIGLETALAEKEKLQGVLEMAGAVCHEMNQPLQVAIILSELLLSDMAPDNPQYKTLVKIKDQIDKMGDITRDIMNTTRYQTMDYLKGKIIDIAQASEQGV